jgi:TolB-like protein
MSLFAELKRRNVIRVAVGYLVFSWLVLQVGDVLIQSLELSSDYSKFIVILLALGAIPALVFSWIYEMTPEGIKKESEIAPDQSVTAHTARKLDLAVIVLLVMAMGMFAADRFLDGRDERITPTAAVTQEAAVSAAPVEVVTPEDTLALGVAVLPFSNLSTDEENAFFASGVHEDVLTYLSRVADLRVISRTSVENYAESDLSLPAIGRELGVSHVVEGSVRRAGTRVRVTVQLIDAETDAHIWSENYDRDLVDIFAIQSEIAQAIVAQVQVVLSPQEAEELAAADVANIEAYDLLIRGREILAQGLSDSDDDAVLEAAELLELAVRADASQVGAWVRLVEACGLVIWRFPDEEAADCRTWMDEALAELSTLAPASTETLVATAMHHYYVSSDPAAATEILAPLVETAPNNLDVLQFLGLSARRIGRWELAIDAMRRAVLLDPANPRRYWSLENILADRAAYAEAIEVSAAALQRFPDNWTIRSRHAGLMRDGRGDIAPYRDLVHAATPLQRRGLSPTDTYGVFESLEGTLAWIDSADRTSDDPLFDFRYQLNLSITYWGWGEPEQGRASAQRTREALHALGESRVSWKGSPTFLTIEAVAAALAGDHEDAQALREQALILVEDLPDIVIRNNLLLNLAYVPAMAGDTEGGWREYQAMIGVPSGDSEWQVYLGRFNRVVFADVPEFQALIARLDAELAARESNE